MPTCTCETIDLYYEVHGEGTPLLLISGLGGGSWSWYGQVPYFSQYYRTIVFDNRGAGRSSMPPGPYTMDQLARDALCLLDRLEVEKAFVLGLSMGGHDRPGTRPPGPGTHPGHVPRLHPLRRGSRHLSRTRRRSDAAR